jgi:hypothetical protein
VRSCRARLLISILLVLCLAVFGAASIHNDALDEYVTFLEQQKTSPVDYVMGLFEKHDVVILCERAHPEMTQYDLIFELVADPRFLEHVGHVYTELGTSSIRPRVESYLTGTPPTEADPDEQLKGIFRDFDWGTPAYVRPNYYRLLRRVRELNQPLPPDRKVRVFPSDLPFAWHGMSAEKYQVFRKDLRRRDQIIAEQIIEKHDAIRQSADTRKKALVVMNYRHAFDHLSITRGGRTKRWENVGGFLMAAYPGKVANVMLNSFRMLPGSSDTQAGVTAVSDGRWDAAFVVVGERSVGFDFEGSPFGDDRFDYFPLDTGQEYRDAFTGFVFHEPLRNHKMVLGIPELVDESFEGELRRRYSIIGPQLSAEQITEKIDRLKTVREFGYEYRAIFPRADFEEKIQQWLE